MIKGTVFDSATGETLPNANVYFSDKQGTPGSAKGGTATDVNGKYIFPNYTVNQGIQTSFPAVYLTASYTGYALQTITVTGNADFHLLATATTLPEVEIIGTRTNTTATIKEIPSNILIYTIGGILAAAIALFIVIKKSRA